MLLLKSNESRYQSIREISANLIGPTVTAGGFLSQRIDSETMDPYRIKVSAYSSGAGGTDSRLFGDTCGPTRHQALGRHAAGL